MTDQELTPTETAARALIDAARDMGVQSLPSAISRETETQLRALLDQVPVDHARPPR